MTDEERAALVSLLREEHGFVGYVGERIGRSFEETAELIASDPECAAVRDYEQMSATDGDGADRAAAACRRQIDNPDIRHLVAVRLRQRREETPDAFFGAFLPGRPNPGRLWRSF